MERGDIKRNIQINPKVEVETTSRSVSDKFTKPTQKGFEIDVWANKASDVCSRSQQIILRNIIHHLRMLSNKYTTTISSCKSKGSNNMCRRQIFDVFICNNSFSGFNDSFYTTKSFSINNTMFTSLFRS